MRRVNCKFRCDAIIVGVGAELRGNAKKTRVDVGERCCVRLVGKETWTTTMGRNGKQAVDENNSIVTASSRSQNVVALNGVMAPH
jgi:hypothetical protein